MDRKALLFLFLALGSCSFPLRSEFFPCIHSTAQNRQYLINKINYYREKNNLSELYVDSRLTRMAQNRAQSLVESPKPSHIDKDGRGPLERLQAGGLRRGFVGENFTFLFSEKKVLDKIFLTWMQKGKERQNLLSASYARIGTGLALKGRYCVAVALFTD